MCIIKIRGTSDGKRTDQPHSRLNYILFNSINFASFNKAMQNFTLNLLFKSQNSRII